MTGALTGVMLSTVTSLDDAANQAKPGTDYASFAVSRLTCVIGNNRALDEHRAWYNGVFTMTSPDEMRSPFVPLYAGLNLENYFDARPRHRENAIFFEPRANPVAFKRLSGTSAELYQAATPFYGIESWTTFELREPYYVDFSFRCIPRKPDLAGGFFGVFWASYINEPADKSVYFLAAGSTLDKPVWTQYCTQEHDRDSTVPQETDTLHLAFEPTAKTLLWNQISPLRYSEPFYYGRFGHMVLIYIFEPNPGLRFSHSPSGGGRTQAQDDTNPAWDFQLVVPHYGVNEEYKLKMRLVYKPWVDRADVLREVRAYLDR